MRWTVVVPAKSPARAKTRLAATTATVTGGGALAGHEQLVQALRDDTIAAAGATPTVARVVVVVDDPAADSAAGAGGAGAAGAGAAHPAGVADVIVQSGSGLNAALAEAWAVCAGRWPEDGVAALLGDLPALRPADLAAALAEAAGTPLGYVADADATGTTLLTARPGARLQPSFGAGSAARHAKLATALPAAAGLRRDVDTYDDLVAVLELGVGPNTAATVQTSAQLSEQLSGQRSGQQPSPASSAGHGGQVMTRSPRCDRMAP